MNRTLMGEIIAGIVALVISALVGGLWTDVKDNRDLGRENKEHIESGMKIGEGEIKRSTAVDVKQETDILDNRLAQAKDHDQLILLRIEVGKLQTAIQHLHKAKE